jgi:N-acetyl-gamma-glutamyl-phosphate reductase
MIRVGIVGALGYGGGQLVRILARHPGVELTYLSSELDKPLRMADVLPNLRGFLDADCEVYQAKDAVERCELLFMAQHPGWAMKEAGRFLDASVKVIDLSTDFRIRKPAVYEEWYKINHLSPELIEQAVYGLPELYRAKLPGASLVANPGCYPTGAILALAPLLKEKLVDSDTIIVDSKTGVSGAGRMALKLDFHFPELNESMKAYNVGVHRHTPEMEQEMGVLTGKPVTISFTPHLIPVTRGIMTTAYAKLLGPATTEDLTERFRAFYKDDYFVYVLDAGNYPATKDVYASNFCHIGLKVDERTGRVVVLSAIDNLVKGMAGEAVQNMNLVCGFDERTGLDVPGTEP